MDTIFIENMGGCVGTHGLTEKERKPQTFEVSVEADVESVTHAAETDDIGNATDYRKICTIVEQVIGGNRHRDLIETLACDIAKWVLDRLPAVCEVRVRLVKSVIWRNGRPGVIVRRKRE